MMKKMLSILLAGAILLSASLCFAEGAKYTAGEYTSKQFGMGGYFNVKVTFSENEILSIEAPDNFETPMLGTEAIRILSDRILEYQSLGIDVVNGATYTSYALIGGVTDCVKQAGGNVDELKKVPAPVETYADKKHEADIIIVGAGLSGVTAALNAKERGGDVILLEEKEYIGGNTTMSSGTFLLGATNIQKNLGIEDTPEKFAAWSLEHSNQKKDPDQMKMIGENSQKLIDFYAANGVKWNTEKVNPTDSSDTPRGHSVTPNIASVLTSLAQQLEAKDVDVRYGTHVTGFTFDDAGKINGVTATDYYGNAVEYKGNKIVLASGGWCDNPEMVGKYWGKEYETAVYGGAKGMDGTMLNAALALGADTVDMEELHIDATHEISRGLFITTNLLRYCGGILVRQSTSERFVDEQAEHADLAAKAIRDLGDPYYFEICDQSIFEYSAAVTDKANSYVNMGLATKYESLEEMAQANKLDTDKLKASIDRYNAAVRGEQPDEFGRERFADELKAPFYVLKVKNGVGLTRGGLKINANLQVLTTEGSIIENLYAIGEITGGSRSHYVGGNALAFAGISGLVVGEQLTR